METLVVPSGETNNTFIKQWEPIKMEIINPTLVIQKQLATGMGLDKYQEIQKRVNQIDVSKDLDFQREFNGFYRVRRNKEWRDSFYDLFENVKQNGPAEFGYILDEMYRLTGNVEASFSSKMLATLRPEMPIWDKYVLMNLRLKVPQQNDSERLSKTKELYADIVQWYEGFLQSDNAIVCITKFDEALPDYKWLSTIKKIDFFLWSIR